MSALVIVSCGKSKIWKKHPYNGPTQARLVYTGIPFILNRKYAEYFSNNWIILSAKYGFIKPDFIILENYDVTFNDTTTNPINIEELTGQAIKYTDYECIIPLGGKTYSNIVKKIFKENHVIAPTYGLPIGKAMNKVKTTIETKTPFKCPYT